MSNRPRIMPVNFFDEAVNLKKFTTAAITMANLQVTSRDPWRSTGLAQQIITGDWGGNSRQISAWGLWPELFGSSLLGALVRVELFTDSTLVTRVYDSGTIDVLATMVPNKGANWGTFLWGGQTWGVDSLDRTSRLAALTQYFAAVTAGAFRLTISNGGAIDTSWIGARRFWLADYVEAPDFANFGVEVAWQSNSNQARTVGGSLRRRRRARWKDLTFSFDLITEADRSAWHDVIYQCELAGEIVFSILPADTTVKLTRDFTVMGSLKSLNPMAWSRPIRNQVKFQITES